MVLGGLAPPPSELPLPCGETAGDCQGGPGPGAWGAPAGTAVLPLMVRTWLGLVFRFSSARELLLRILSAWGGVFVLGGAPLLAE